MSIEFIDGRVWCAGWSGPSTSHAKTVTKINTGWMLPPPLTGASSYPISRNDVANALVFDSNAGLSVTRSRSFVGIYIEEKGGVLFGRKELNALSSNMKATEPLSCALTIAYARLDPTTNFVANTHDVNKLRRLGAPVWRKRWPKSHGPDYIVCAGADAWFVEIKGMSSSGSMGPAKFAVDKAQSLNARLESFLPKAKGHVLVYGVLAPGFPVQVRVFNHRSEVKGGDESCVPHVALTQFLTQLRNSGYAHLADMFLVPGVKKTALDSLLGAHFERHGTYWIEREGDLRFAIDVAAVQLFAEVARSFANGVPGELVHRLLALADRQAPEGEVLGRSPTGVAVVAYRPYVWPKE